MIKSKEELDTALCNYCPLTDGGTKDVNTNQYNLCEGSNCDEAYQHYLNEMEELSLELQTAEAIIKELYAVLEFTVASRKPIPARIEIATLGRCVYPPLDIAHNNALAPIESYISKRMEELRCLDAK